MDTNTDKEGHIFKYLVLPEQYVLNWKMIGSPVLHPLEDKSQGGGGRSYKIQSVVVPTLSSPISPHWAHLVPKTHLNTFSSLMNSPEHHCSASTTTITTTGPMSLLSLLYKQDHRLQGGVCELSKGGNIVSIGSLLKKTGHIDKLQPAEKWPNWRLSVGGKKFAEAKC